MGHIFATIHKIHAANVIFFLIMSNGLKGKFSEEILINPEIHNLFRCVHDDALANKLYPDVIAQTMDAEVLR